MNLLLTLQWKFTSLPTMRVFYACSEHSLHCRWTSCRLFLELSCCISLSKPHANATLVVLPPHQYVSVTATVIIPGHIFFQHTVGPAQRYAPRHNDDIGMIDSMSVVLIYKFCSDMLGLTCWSNTWARRDVIVEHHGPTWGRLMCTKIAENTRNLAFHLHQNVATAADDL